MKTAFPFWIPMKKLKAKMKYSNRKYVNSHKIDNRNKGRSLKGNEPRCEGVSEQRRSIIYTDVIEFVYENEGPEKERKVAGEQDRKRNK
jgi:hypothetical protein